jgi:hypothetical protein
LISVFSESSESLMGFLNSLCPKIESCDTLGDFHIFCMFFH